MKELKVKLTFLESILGTQTGDKDVYRSFIGSKAPDARTIEDEVEAVGQDEVIDKAKTWFPRTEDGRPFIYDYWLRGFFKSACSALRSIKDTKSSKVKAYKKKVDLNIFIKDRKNIIEDYNLEDITECQRPLRCSTMQGERVSIAISEEIPAGATVTFIIQCLDDGDIPLVKEWLDFGQFNGLGQWRNSGHGKFTWEEVKEND